MCVLAGVCQDGHHKAYDMHHGSSVLVKAESMSLKTIILLELAQLQCELQVFEV